MAHGQLRSVITRSDELPERPLDIDTQDLDGLLRTEPSLWLGRIMELNRQPRYHNRLNAVVLIGLLHELLRNTAAMGRALGQHP